MLEQLRNSLSAQLALVPALSVLIVFSTACSHPVSTAATGEALNLSGIDVLAGDLTERYETDGLEEMFRHAQGDTRVTTVIERLRDGGYQPEIETLRDAAYDGRVPIEALLQGLDPAMDPDVESAFSTLHDAVRADFVLHTSLGGEVGARREALVWWVVTIIVVVAVAVSETVPVSSSVRTGATLVTVTVIVSSELVVPSVTRTVRL